jgi:hypothetical protein
MWDQSSWLLKATRSSTRGLACEVYISDTGESLAEAILGTKPWGVFAFLPVRAPARSELRLKGTEAPCLTVLGSLTWHLTIGLFVAGGMVQINDENDKVLATFKGRPFMRSLNRVVDLLGALNGILAVGRVLWFRRSMPKMSP